MDNGDIPDKGIFFALPKTGDETCLLTCKPNDVDLTASECRKLGTALVDSADIMAGSALLDELNDPENVKWFRRGRARVAELEETVDRLLRKESAYLREAGEKERRIAELEAFLGELFEGCEYGDDCPPFVATNHHKCRACQIRRLLAGKPDGAS